MRRLIGWFALSRAWSASHLELPELDASADPALQRWCAVAGGLALILSRASPSECAARFSCTGTLYELVQRQLRQSQPVVAAAELVGEVMHEVADVADPVTRRCLRACFDASLRRPRRGDLQPASGGGRDTALAAFH